MLNANEIAIGYEHRYGDYNEFCERFGVDKSRIARAEGKRQQGIPDGLFCAIPTKTLEPRKNRGVAGEKRWHFGGYENAIKQGEGKC